MLEVTVADTGVGFRQRWRFGHRPGQHPGPPGDPLRRAGTLTLESNTPRGVRARMCLPRPIGGGCAVNRALACGHVAHWPFGWRRGLAYALLWATAMAPWKPSCRSQSCQILGDGLGHRGRGDMAARGVAGSCSLALRRTALSRSLCAGAGACRPAALLMGRWSAPMTPCSVIVAAVCPRPDRPVQADTALPIWPGASCRTAACSSAACALAYRAERTRATARPGRDRAQPQRGACSARRSWRRCRVRSTPPSCCGCWTRCSAATPPTRRVPIGLLDQLVGFLRLAMPGVRSGQSTLAAELALVRSYAQLWPNSTRARAAGTATSTPHWPTCRSRRCCCCRCSTSWTPPQHGGARR